MTEPGRRGAQYKDEHEEDVEEEKEAIVEMAHRDCLNRCADVPKSVAHSSRFTSDGQGPQRVSAGAPPVLQWCSSVVGAESSAHDNLCQIVPFCATSTVSLSNSMRDYYTPLAGLSGR